MDDPEIPAKPDRKALGRPFAKGNAGRPKGARNRSSVALEAMLDGQAEAIVLKAISLALKGDKAALRLCFHRILGKRPDRAVQVDLPPIRTVQDGALALAGVITAIAEGRVSPAEAAEIANVIAATISAIESSEFERRLEKLEKKQSER